MLTSSSFQHPLVFPGSSKAEEALHLGGPSTTKSIIHVASANDGEWAVYESGDWSSGDSVLGVLLRPSRDDETLFDDVFACFLLKNIRPLPAAAPPADAEGPQSRETTDQIVDAFDMRLRYAGDKDKWRSHGRGFFSDRVYEFVRRGVPVEFCLPAFPCKSSNSDKTAGTMPDRGEQLALEHLYSFLEAIDRIYDPGAMLWIVSDGHVFSDCSRSLRRPRSGQGQGLRGLLTDVRSSLDVVGVDDETVDRYSAELIAMSASVGRRRGSQAHLAFRSLVDLFDLAQSAADVQHLLTLPPLEPLLATQRTPAAELSRQLLMHSCGAPASSLRSRIAAGDDDDDGGGGGGGGTLQLYRGFSRFMCEDLARNRHAAHLSRGGRKRLATQVAFEMMRRNDAYSNLVGLFFPHHVRLSIHAHDNAGPKFGIRLFGPGVRALGGLSFGAAAATAETRPVDLLHVPTPWHNCVVSVAGHAGLVLTKARVVRDALAGGEFRGGWVDGGGEAGSEAGHFRLRKRADHERKVEDDDVLDC